MFFFLPIGVEGFKVRVPLVSLCIVLICTAAFLVTWVANPNREFDDSGAIATAFRSFEEHPYLSLPESVEKQLMTSEGHAEIEVMRAKWLSMHAVPRPEVIAEEQAALDALFDAANAALAKNPMRRWAFVPARGVLQPGLITSMFLHFGWLHLLGNLLFFALCAPMLEDAWGRSLFAAFYLLGGLAGTIAHFTLDHHSLAALAGASGAIAACMGAFAVRFAGRRVLIAYVVFLGFRLLRGVWKWPAWVCGVLWFAGQLFDFVTGGASGVAVMAHLGGFAFGAAAAFGMKAIGLEKDLLGTSELDLGPLQRSYAREATFGFVALQQGDPVAARNHFNSIAGTDDDAALGLVRLDFDEGQKAGAIRRLDLLLQRLIRRNDEHRAAAVLAEMWPRIEASDLKPTTALAAAKTVDADGSWHMALPLFEQGGNAPGYAGLKSLIRALELHVGQRAGARAKKVLARIDLKGGHGPFTQQIESLRPEVERLVTMNDVPISEETPIASDRPFEPPVPVRHPLNAIPCRVTAVGDDGVMLELRGKRFETLPWAKIAGVAAGIVPRPDAANRNAGALVVDFIIAWATREAGIQTYRFDSTTTNLSALFPGETSAASFRAFIAEVFERAELATALPNIGLLRGNFIRYASIDARDESLFGAR